MLRSQSRRKIEMGLNRESKSRNLSGCTTKTKANITDYMTDIIDGEFSLPLPSLQMIE